MELNKDLEYFKEELLSFLDYIESNDVFDKIKACTTLPELKKYLTDNGADISEDCEDLVESEYYDYVDYCEDGLDEDDIYFEVKDMIFGNHTCLETECGREDIFIVFDKFKS